MSKCYSCEYKQYKNGDNEPNKECPEDCTIISLLSVVEQIKQKFPELENFGFSEKNLSIRDISIRSVS